MTSAAVNTLLFYDHQPQNDNLYDEVITGLNKHPRTIPPKFFYDETGSKLFEAICKMQEYYLTRTEMSILKDNIDEIANYIGEGCLLIEPGSGNCHKVRVLLDAIAAHTYMPLDISRDYLLSVAHGLVREYPELNVTAACVDYTLPQDFSYYPQGMRRVAFFPGSSIGNFELDNAVQFLGNIAELVQKEGSLLIGVDLQKDPDILNAAYNDTQGTTAAFNLNLLTRINRELGADFQLDNFTHSAFYNEKKGRIEMHLISRCAQTVKIGRNRFTFKQGETIHTENSYKYTIDGFHDLTRRAGFVPVKVWTDAAGLFSVHYLRRMKRIAGI